MSEQPERRRRYSDKEVSLILKRAAELQQKEPGAGVERTGLTFDELEEIATEAGLDPRHLRRAAAELESRPAGSGLASRFFGAPMVIRLERTIEGELPESEFESIVELLQGQPIGQGQASTVGRTLTWRSHSTNTERSLQISITVRDGTTLVRMEERLQGLAGGLFGGLMGGVGGGVGLGVGLGVGIEVLGSALFAAGIPILVIGGSYLTARGIYTYIVRRRGRALTALMDRLGDLIRTASTDRRVDPAPSRELPRS